MKNQFLFFFKELHKDANGRVRIVAEYMILSSRSKDSDPIEIGPVQARNPYCPSKSIHSKAQEWAKKFKPSHISNIESDTMVCSFRP